MKRRIFGAVVTVSLLGMGCPRPNPSPDAGITIQAPADQVFSIGITQKTGSPPQTASPLQLKFRGGTPSSDTVVAQKLTKAITVDGDAADWAEIPGSTLPLIGPGHAIGMSQAEWDSEWQAATRSTRAFDHGVSEVSAKAALDEERIYFLLQWADADESLNHQWVFSSDAGAFVRNTEDKEDRAYLSFNVRNSYPAHDVVGCIAACHVKERLGAFDAGDVSYRFAMHTGAAGELADVWNWKATHSNPMGIAADQHWTQVRRLTDPRSDGGPALEVAPPNCACGCFAATCPDGGVNGPKYMGEDGVNSSPNAIFLENTGKKPRAVPFDPAGARDGDRIPGHYFQVGSPEAMDIKAVGKWANGKWTVEFSRALTTGDEKDAQFPIE